MSMLAERKRKTKYSLNPRGNQWAQDSNKFGQKMLERMGWKHGKGLGAKEDGIIDHVKVSYKNDSKGMGYKGNDDQWTEHEDKFAALLTSLSGGTDSKDVSVSSLEKKSQSSKARVHYKKFTQGKDLSRYSEKDLANIFGKKSLKEEKVKAKMDELNEKPQLANNEYLINSGSMTDYFKSKLPNLNKTAVKSDYESESEISHSLGFGFKCDTSPKHEKTTFVSYVSENKRKAEEEDFTPRKKAKKEVNQEQDMGVSNPAFNPLSTPIKLERHVLETIEESVNEDILELSGDKDVNLENSLEQSSNKKQKRKNKDTDSGEVTCSKTVDSTSQYIDEGNKNFNYVVEDTAQSIENAFEVKRKKSKSKDKSLVEKNLFEVKLKKKKLAKFAAENPYFDDFEDSSVKDTDSGNISRSETVDNNSQYTDEGNKILKYGSEDSVQSSRSAYEVKRKKSKSKDKSLVEENPFEVKLKKKKLPKFAAENFGESTMRNNTENIQDNSHEVNARNKKSKYAVENPTFDPTMDVYDNLAEAQKNPYEVKLKSKKKKSVSGIDNCNFDSSIDSNLAGEVHENPYEVKIKKKKKKNFAIENPSFDMNTDSVSENSVTTAENPYEIKIKKKINKHMLENSVCITQISASNDVFEVKSENGKPTDEAESLTPDTSISYSNFSSMKSTCEVKLKKKQKKIQGILNPALNLNESKDSISNDIVEEDQLMLNVAIIPVQVQAETKSVKSSTEMPQHAKRRKSVTFNNVKQEVIIPNNEDVSNGLDNQCFDKQKSLLDENMQFISKTLDRFEAEIENDLNEEKQLMIGEVGNPSGNHEMLPDGTTKLKFKHSNLGTRTPIYHLDKTGPMKSYKHLIKGDIVLQFKETNLHEIQGYAVKKETLV